MIETSATININNYKNINKREKKNIFSLFNLNNDQL